MIRVLNELAQGVPYSKLDLPLDLDPSVPHAPDRKTNLSPSEFAQAIRNALRYFPPEYHEKLASQFAEELRTRGHIWMPNLRPTEYEMKAYNISQYPAKLAQCKAIQLMIMNNLDPSVAQYPHELITYGGNGSVFSNWAQYHLTMKYLCEMEDNQTLVMNSGHPLGLFPSTKDSPRVIISNGQVIPNYSSKDLYDKFFALGVTMFGQMTAGSYCYIGPQGIVHGTTLTLLNAGRKYLGLNDLTGKVFVTSGLGGMSGAQPKAGCISGCITVVAEINHDALAKRYDQGWVQKITHTIEETISLIKSSKSNSSIISIAYYGNIVDLWEALSDQDELLVDLGSDQTSLHDPYGGGYYPVGISYSESKTMISKDPSQFKALVQRSLLRQISAIQKLTNKGMKFWDYGNSFLLEVSRAGADIIHPQDPSKFIYPSYVEDIMGNIFSLGFGPFRWICTSGDNKDLKKTDLIAEEVILKLMSDPECPLETRNQYEDNLKWIREAENNNLVVGSKARILYTDTLGRVEIATRFNEAVAGGSILGPIVISRDHHDVSGTDSPYRETSNIGDGSKFTADMAVQTALGNCARGATWVSLHNGGGVGWGEVINGGFGLVLDGSEETYEKLQVMLQWDVNNGIARRSWSGHPYAQSTIKRLMKLQNGLNVTIPYTIDDNLSIPTN